MRTASLALARPSWRGVHALALVSILLCVLVVYTTTWGHTNTYLSKGIISWVKPPSASGTSAQDVGGGEVGGGDGEGHPIQRLMQEAQKRFDAVLQENPTSVEDAAKRYRLRRGRHPPPGFGAWYAYAAARGAVVPEVFFDQVYHDLGPFWGVGVDVLQRTVRGFSPKIAVREGAVESAADGNYERVRRVVDMLEELRKDGVQIPDMDVPVNVNDEVAMLVPWESMETAVEFARNFMPAPKDVVTSFSPIREDELGDATFDPQWLDARLRHKAGGAFLGPRPFWSLVRPACPPNSPARKEALMADIWDPRGHTKPEHKAAALLPLEPPANASEGYVGNWTVAADVCLQPNAQGLHGVFVAPKRMSVTKKLFPMFSGSKMGVSNEVLIPTLQESNKTFAPIPWTEKEGRLYWHGPASGGMNSKLNWRRMHRHRFVAMFNATHIEIAEGMLHAGNESTVGLGYAGNFRLLPANAYHLETQKGGRMAEWVNGWADAAFTDLECDGPTEAGGCVYTDMFFSKKKSGEKGNGTHKYAAVLDGDSGDDGGEFVQALQEGKAVLKATLYKQWYDARVMPWVHFIPMDYTYIDLYGIMEYFLGTTVKEDAPAFAHAHVEVEAHEHHFHTPHWDKEDGEEDQGNERRYEEHERRSPSVHDREAGAEGDAQAQKIAEAGQDWANKVLRKEDALVYMYRLLLEYARVIDEKRHSLGWIGDLIEEGT
ncbi:hypothetical protein N0V90_008034 [Kalmusia sp. IMI 367209]|nr:hypothetical protein N0V90_008034 [Kalmusia sp. IMI 367209]